MLEEVENHLQDCVTLLLKQRKPLVELRDARRKQAKQADDLIKNVDRAVAGLQSNSSSNSRRKATGKSAQSCSNKQEILELMRLVLQENQSVPVDDLKELVADRLRERKRSLSMYANIFAKCLREPEFQEATQGVYELAKPTIVT